MNDLYTVIFFPVSSGTSTFQATFLTRERAEACMDEICRTVMTHPVVPQEMTGIPFCLSDDFNHRLALNLLTYTVECVSVADGFALRKRLTETREHFERLNDMGQKTGFTQ